MSTLILFPGLGASERLFERFHFGNRKVHVINFLIPQKNETLQHYSRRMAEKIPPGDDFIFIGVSFGGILAQEVSQIVPAKKIILISTIKSTAEKPAYFSLFRLFPLYRMLPEWLMKKTVVWFGNLMIKRSYEDQMFFISLLRESDIRVIRWGIYQTLHWKHRDVLPDIIHIHGSKDLLFPIKKLRVDHVIEGGNHFMIIQRAPEINVLINKLLDGIPDPKL